MPLFHRGDSCRASKGMILEYLILKCFDWEVVLYLLDRNSPPYWGAVNALINKHWRNLCFRLLPCVYTVQWAPQVVLVVKTPPVDAGDVRDRVQPVGGEDPLEEGLAAHSRILAWRIPWTEEPSRLQFMGSQSRTWLSDLAHSTHTPFSRWISAWILFHRFLRYFFPLCVVNVLIKRGFSSFEWKHYWD